VYVDAYNLYYGMRSFCGRGSSGWRWLDVRALATALCGWQGSSVSRVVYCTARVDQNDDPSAYSDQDVYLKALKSSNSIDVLELGRYVAWPKKVPLADVGLNGKANIVVPKGHETWSPELPILKKTGSAKHPDDLFLATVRLREEKGSDVNVATHLLADVFRQEVDAAIVISNDSDLALPLTVARSMVPVGTVNPGSKPLAGALRGLKSDGPGRHFWANLSSKHFIDNQLSDPVDRWRKPTDW
jgi:hypothetical protein